MTTIPEPLRGNEPETWQYDTIANRLPAMALRVVNENKLTLDQTDKLHALAEEMPFRLVRPLTDQRAPDFPAWDAYVRPHVGQNWLDVPWFFAEMYFFRRILEATGYFEPGIGFGQDPYRHQKHEGLAAAGAGLAAMTALTTRECTPETLRLIFIQDLWGNQADLSIWPMGDGESSLGPNGGHLLVDDLDRVINALMSDASGKTRIDVLADNAGLEFGGDLLLIEYLLRHKLAEVVYLHLKPYPTFVSDATAPDLTTHLASFRHSSDQNLRIAGDSLTRFLGIGRLRVRSHHFWASPLAMWEMPQELRFDLNQSALVILKGDMNYRRLVGDRHWPYTTPVEGLPTAVDAKILALRVCKAEVAVGMSEQTLAMVNEQDPAWRVNGHWGMAQVHPPRSGV